MAPTAPGNGPTYWPLDVELDVGSASRDEIVLALVAVGCGRAAAETLAASLKPAGSSIGRPSPLGGRCRVPGSTRCRPDR